MSKQLSTGEKELLRGLLSNTLFQKSIELALTKTAILKSGETTIDGSAMAYQYQEGARDFVSCLFGLAEINETPVVKPIRLIHNA